MDNSEKQFLLNCRRLPARLTLEEAGVILGFLPHEMRVLLSGGVLKAAVLARPAQNGHKWLATTEVLKCSESREWLERATSTVARHWQDKNRGAQAHLMTEAKSG